MNVIELKSCPFCGGKAKLQVCDGSGTIYEEIGTKVLWGRQMTHFLIRCNKCYVKTTAYATTRGVFKRWNRRV